MGWGSDYQFYNFPFGIKFVYFWETIGFEKTWVTFCRLMLDYNYSGQYFCITTKSLLVNRQTAIIMSPSVTAKSTPDAGGTDLFILHEGHKILVKDATMKDWCEIQLEDGSIGWIPRDVIEII